MSLTTVEIGWIVQDLAPRIAGGYIKRMDQPEKHRLVFRIRRGECVFWLLFCTHPQFSRLHLLPSRPEEGEPATGFGNALRQHLTGAPVQGLRQVDNDRVVVLDSVERDALKQPHSVRLVAELIGVGSNLILLDEDDRVLACLFTEDSDRRTLFPGMTYTPLPPPPDNERASRNRFSHISPGGDEPLALSRAIYAAYAEKEAGEKLEEMRDEVDTALQDQVKYLESRQSELEDALDEAEDAEELRKKGELLKIALPRLQKGQREVTVQDHFSTNQEQITLELDPSRTPEQNMKDYFERYKKLTRSRKTLQKRLENTRKRLRAARVLSKRTADAESRDELSELKDKARQVGATFPEDRPPPQQQQEGRDGPRRFMSRDDYTILVARNENQNRELTFTIARGNDYWMHVMGHPGPHVIIRKPRDCNVPQTTLVDAAHLAIYYSELGATDFAQVVYTLRKYVKQIKGRGPGRVGYSNASTLQVRVSRARLKRLLDSRPPAPTGD
mgnify:CR=1 FL=1